MKNFGSPSWSLPRNMPCVNIAREWALNRIEPTLCRATMGYQRQGYRNKQDKTARLA